MPPSSILPAAVRDVISAAGAVAFSGSRSPATAETEKQLTALLDLIGPEIPVLVGCARGVDAAVRAARPDAFIFRVQDMCAAEKGPRRYHFAKRSQWMIRTLAELPAPLLVVFPAGPCPPGLAPSSNVRTCFSGHGSGTWATAAFAAGLGIPVLVWFSVHTSLATWPVLPLSNGWVFISEAF